MRLKPEVPPPPSTPVALGRWARARGESEPLARALEAAAAAETEGHACTWLDPQTVDLPALRAHPWVSDGSRIAPLVIDTAGRAFLWRNWIHEERVADGIAARASAAADDADAAVAADLETLFAGVDPQRGAQQRAAVRGIVGQRFFVLSGGPGTGKTTTVLRMLLMRLRIAQRAGVDCAIAMAAPTGKAAQRLSQAMRSGIESLRAALGDQREGWEAALRALPESAQTLHRLLGAQPALDRFRHHREQPLPQDLVVVDEASMVDLGLMRALLDALAPHATLVLVGDPDQLVSVSAGSVLADLVEAAARPAMSGQHVRLLEVWRADAHLAQVYAAVRAGDRAALDVLLQPEAGAVRHPVAHAAALAQRLQQWLQRPEWIELDTLLAAPAAEPAAAFEQMRRLQLLTALREGDFGAAEVNRSIDEHRRRIFDRALWYPGRPVLVRHNDYNRRLFNGDVGLALWHEGRLTVCFETTDSEGRTHYRHLLPSELPEHDLGYALTIHKSQGSEYDHVAVLLPPDAAHRVLSRQLLYTGVSRARRSLEIWASEASFTSALARRSERQGGLRARLMDDFA